MLLDILLIIILILLIIFIIATWKYDYWRKRNVPYVKPTFPFGCFNKTFLGRTTFTQQLKKYYNEYSEYRYFGIYVFRHPYLFIRDPELVKCVLIKNFQNFRDNVHRINGTSDPLAANNPFILKGDKWKVVRNQLTPAFSPAKIKTMFPNMVSVSKKLVKYLKDNPNLRKGVSAKELGLYFATENVALCGLNIDARSFENDPKNLKNIAGNLFQQNENFRTFLLFILIWADPHLNNFLRLKLLSKEVTKFISTLVKDVLNHRRRNNVRATDYLDYLLQVQQKCKDIDFSDLDIIANFTTLFIDGVDTSSLMLAFLLYEVASHPRVFKQLRHEIDTKITDDLTYESLSQLPYLDSCFNESLRKNTPILFQARECTEPFTLPPPYKGYPQLTVEKGTYVFIPSYLLHHDPKYYPDPDSFMPERFYNDQRNEKRAVEMFFPFGDGPRICLGRNFGTAQIKAATVALVKNFDIIVNSKTKEVKEPQSPIFVNVPSGNIYLDIYDRGEIYTE